MYEWGKVKKVLGNKIGLRGTLEHCAIRTGKMERGGGHGFGGTCPHFFSIKNKNDVKSFHLDREESFRYHVFPVKSQLGEVLGPVLVARAPKNPPIFLLYRKNTTTTMRAPTNFQTFRFPCQCNAISRTVWPFMARCCTELSKFNLSLPMEVWIWQLLYSREF